MFSGLNKRELAMACLQVSVCAAVLYFITVGLFLLSNP